MEPKSFGRDTVISSTQLVQYDDDEDNEDKLDSSHSDHQAPSRHGIVDLGGGGQSANPHLDGQAHMSAQAGMGGELSRHVGGTNVGLDIDRGAEGEDHEGQDISEGDMVLQEGEVDAAGVLASDEAMRVYCAYGATDVGHGDLTASSAQGVGDVVHEYAQEDELQERAMEGVLEEVPGDQGGYIAEGVVEEASSFSEMQQTQLRAQILIYGDLIKGVLPQHNLMLTAFQDGPEAFGPDSDRNSPSGWNWEQHWQVAAMKHQSELDRQAEEGLGKDKGDVTMIEGEQLENALPETLEPGTPSTAPSRVADQSLKQEVYPAVMPETADLSVAHLDAPSIDVNEDLTVNLDVVVDKIVATTVSSIGSALLQPGGNLAPDSSAVIGASAARPGVTPMEGFGVANEAGHTPGTRSPSLDPWLRTPSAVQNPPLCGAIPLQAPSPQSAAWQAAAWPSPFNPTNVAHSSQEGAMSMPFTNVPHDIMMPNSTQYPSHPVNGGIATGVTPMSMGVAANVEEEPGSRKRKKGAGKTKERKPTTTSPRPRARARKGSAAPVVSPSTTIDPNFPSPSGLIYESSAAAGVASATSPTSPLAPTVVERRDGLARQSLHTDTANWVEQARVSFEEAMTAANSAQHESQLVNKQAPKNRVSGNEAKYASAADAVKVAASVAKAAADAAKVAYEAALQARLFVFEGVEASSGKNFALTIRADKDGGAGGRRSAIAAAKEEARKRASGIPSASKANPQSTDAVLRAAKLMTEAAAEAGAVLAKGNTSPSIPLSTVSPVSVPSHGEEQRKSKSSDRRGRPRKVDASLKSVAQPAVTEQQPVKTPKEGKQSWKKGARKKGKDVLDAVATPAKTSSKKTEDLQVKQSPEKPIRRQLEQAMASASNHPGQQFTEESLVEVMNDEEGLRGGWFSAQVLEIKGGQAYVQYDEILTDDGKTKLKEWFPLEGKMEGPEPGRPRIRLIITQDNLAKEEGRQDKQRKRRRTATKDRAWAVGDRADAFVQDGWWEGIVQTVDEDENKVTMHFPGEGDTQTVKVKNLRPSLVWKNGKWEEWTAYGNTQDLRKDEEKSAKRQKAGISPKSQARKTPKKPNSEVKASEEGKDSPRTTRRGKPLDPQGESQPSPAIVNTRSSPRQKLPPKRKDGATKLASPESEVSTPNQVSTPVCTRTRSLPQDAVNSDKEPSKGRIAPTGSASQKNSPLSQKVGKKNQSKENGETPSNRRNLRNSKEQTPSPVIGTPTTRQKAKAGASTQNQRSARV